ncbi:MAG: hypothetical protein KBS82_05580 [Oscillospiraceae bacterium]|nr:hypothetical protein [Candidatus Limimonas egerieequi]
MPKLKDLTGQRFGSWTVIERAQDKITKSNNKFTVWKCVCDCGTEREVVANSLLSGRSTSCGCEHSKIMTHVAKENFTTHGKTNTRLYQIWAGMRKRCFNPNSSNYANYGGRGISICDQWSDFEVFESWANQNDYSDSKSIDRINVDGNYCPENCRWVDSVAQANNRRSNTFYTYNGESHTLAEWAKIKNVSYKGLWKKVSNGNTLEQIFN